MRYLLWLFVGFAFTVNGQDAEPVVSKDGTHFGEKISAKGAMSYDDLLVKLGEKEELNNVKVEGKVESVCQAKGCWMNIVSVNGDKEPMMVRFKDYGFFVPKDISGRVVVLKGRAYKEETSVEDLRHYAEDDGKSAEEIAAITEPKMELKFLAEGVILKD